MTVATDLIDQLEPLHADAFSWAVTCCGGDADAAEDALQEAYVKVITGRAVFRGRSALKTWWLGVIRFTVMEQQRRTQRWRRVTDFFAEWFTSLQSIGPGEAVYTEIEPPGVEWLSAALKTLPARQAEILHLIYQQDLSVTEAAAAMSVSVGSARQHFDRAKNKLRSLLPARAIPPPSNHAN